MIIDGVSILSRIAMALKMEISHFTYVYISERLDFTALPSNKYAEVSPLPYDHMTLIRDVLRALCDDKSYNDCLLRVWCYNFGWLRW